MSNTQKFEQTEQEVNSLANDARTLLAATADMVDEKISGARKRVESALEGGKQIYEDIREKATDGIKAADGFLHENPYKSLGIAILLGTVVGMLLRCRK